MRRFSFRRAGEIAFFPVVITALHLLHAVLPQANADDSTPVVKSPLSPEESLRHFQLAAGLKVEIVAAEPEIVDPVSIAFDENGGMYVVEMRDYPNGPEPGQPPLSQIKWLEDRDGDGRYETTHLFADKLLFATGVQPWQGGVIVTLAGEIIYLKDTDGDHKADLREVWFRGFVQENPQLRANHPTFALDNGIYVANGLRGGTIVANPEKWGKEYPPVSISGKDFRFNPLTGECEAVAGNGQFGITFDDSGNRFVCDNRHPCRQVMLEDRYTKRNPFLAPRDVVHDVSPPGEKSHIYPISRAWTTSTQHAGQFTACSGVTIYRGTGLPRECYGDVFVCEPTGNLVHRDEIQTGIPEGEGPTANFSRAAYSARSFDQRPEFLASRDEWFRPVDLANGPDGALYIVDMYRAVIEHPEWVPEELKNRPDTWYGNDRGRIYRIVGEKPAVDRTPPPRLSTLSNAELVKLLKHPNSWQRTTAHRLLYERQDPAVVPQVVELIRDHKVNDVEAGNVEALHLLNGLGKLHDDLLAELLVNADDSTRRAAIQLAEPRLASSPELQQKLHVYRLRQSSVSILQLALSLGELPGDGRARVALAEIVAESSTSRVGDHWLRRAVLTGATERPNLLLRDFLDSPRFVGTVPQSQFLRELCDLIGARQNADEILPSLAGILSLGDLKSPVAKQATELAIVGVLGLGQGVARRGKAFSEVLDQLEEREAGVKAALQPIFAAASKFAVDPQTPPILRADSIALLQFSGFEVAGSPLLKLAFTDPEQSTRLKAIDVLATYRDPQIAGALLTKYPEQTPVLRRGILQALLRDEARTKQLLDEISAGKIAATELDPLSVQSLVKHRNEAIRSSALNVFAALIPADRKQVLDQYQSALKMNPDPRRGMAIFEKNCTACHRIGTLGVDVAPDIADSRTKTPAQLLVDILNPNQAIDNNYVSYTIITNDGKSHTGVISAETPVSITLRQPEGKTVQLLRADVDELRSNGISLMPDGLEKNIMVDQMADLISFIKNWRYLDGAVPAAK